MGRWRRVTMRPPALNDYMRSLLRRTVTPLALLPLLTATPLPAAAASSWLVATVDGRCEAAATYFNELSSGLPPAQTPADVAELWRRGRHYASVEYQTPGRAIVTVSKAQGAKDQVTLGMYRTAADCQGFLEFLKNMDKQGKPQPSPPTAKPAVPRPSGPLTAAHDWFVVSEVRQCEPVVKHFKPLEQPLLSPETPSDVAELLRMRGNSASVQFFSSSAVTVEMQQEKPREPQSWSFYPSMNLCERYMAALNDVRIARDALLARQQAQQPARAPQGAGFGAYRGRASSVEVGLETKDRGTGLVIVNHGATPFTVAPQDVSVQTSTGASKPCTFHLLSLGGMGSPAVPLIVEPGKREGLMLGACMSGANQGALTSPLVVRGAVKSVRLGNVTVPVVPD
jgi:hypothetical protein